MQRRYRIDEIEIFWVLWVTVVGSPRTPYRVLVELKYGPHSSAMLRRWGKKSAYLEQVQNSDFSDSSTKGSRRGTVNTRSYEQA